MQHSIARSLAPRHGNAVAVVIFETGFGGHLLGGGFGGVHALQRGIESVRDPVASRVHWFAQSLLVACRRAGRISAGQTDSGKTESLPVSEINVNEVNCKAAVCGQRLAVRSARQFCVSSERQADAGLHSGGQLQRIISRRPTLLRYW